MIWSFLQTKVGRVVLAVILGVLGFFGIRAKFRADGAAEERKDAQDADRKKADAIRARARNADRVPRSKDKRGFRD